MIHTNGRTFLFDGGLPTRKRIERATRYQFLLRDYVRQPTGRSTKLPPPFVVLVCQQTLVRLSRERQCTVTVVPGEADAFCVRMARHDKSAFILSTDGDFLVYTGEEGNFVPLQKFPMHWGDTLSFPIYTHIRKELGMSCVHGMVEVAALVNEGVNLSVPQCIACVNRQQTLDYISRETLQMYLGMYAAAGEFSPTPEIHKILEAGVLSGRLTELFFTEEAPVHWLPLLPTGNPPRRTAWAVSQPIRQVAYHELRRKGLINGDCVIEMVQRGQRIAEEKVNIENPDVTWIIEGREDMFAIVMKTLLVTASEKEIKFLAYFAGMFFLLEQSRPQLRSATVPNELQYIMLQYQTLIYSLIILQQAQVPLSSDVPEFATLWDLPRFKTALATGIEERKELWCKIMGDLDPVLRAHCERDESARPKRRIKSTKKSKSAKITSEVRRDDGNRFSRLEMIATQDD